MPWRDRSSPARRRAVLRYRRPRRRARAARLHRQPGVDAGRRREAGRRRPHRRAAAAAWSRHRGRGPRAQPLGRLDGRRRDRPTQELAARSARVAVVGLSMGGSLTCWLAERHPEISGIAVVNPLVEPPGDELRSAIHDMLDAGVSEIAPSIGSDIAQPGVAELGYDGTPLAAALSLFEGVEDVALALGDIRCPVLLLSSREDHVVPSTNGDLLAASRRRPVRAGLARAQLPRRHAGLRPGRGRGPHRVVRHRRDRRGRGVSGPVDRRPGRLEPGRRGPRGPACPPVPDRRGARYASPASSPR